MHRSGMKKRAGIAERKRAADVAAGAVDRDLAPMLRAEVEFLLAVLGAAHRDPARVSVVAHRLRGLAALAPWPARMASSASR